MPATVMSPLNLISQLSSQARAAGVFIAIARSVSAQLAHCPVPWESQDTESIGCPQPGPLFARPGEPAPFPFERVDNAHLVR